jgi:hypothetical protein
MSRVRLTLLVLLPLAGCEVVATHPAVEAVPDSAKLLVRDPWLPATERAPTSTLWRPSSLGWLPEARVLAVAPGGRAWVDTAHRLVLDVRVLAEDAHPELSVHPDGAGVAFTRVERAPERDVWLAPPGDEPRPVTTDGRSDRPFFLPDGRLLWVSGAGGIAGFVLDGARLTNRPGEGFVPVPAFADRTRWLDGRIYFHAGDGWWWLDPDTGAAEPTSDFEDPR